MSLSLRISLIIGAIAILIASLVAAANYRIQLNQATLQGQNLVRQMAQNAQGTSSIAAYLIDDELAKEIVEGLKDNDLIAGVSIIAEGQELSKAGELGERSPTVNTILYNPFNQQEVIGSLLVAPNLDYIQRQAAASGQQTAFTLLGLSAIIAMIVGIYVNLKLTRPLRFLSRAFESIDTQQPDKMTDVNIGYAKKDEIGRLIKKTNNMIGALQSRFHSEKQLRESTEELQKRFRLLFEQATAGIALISQDGRVTLSNPAFHELFKRRQENAVFANYFQDSHAVESELKRLSENPDIDQIELDLVCIIEGEKRYLHCLFSSILDSREVVRSDSDSLIEVIVYDITQRREKELKARYEADHDSLTGLLNRRSGKRYLQDKLDQLQQSQDSSFALMMIDLDKFKPINDTHGHDAGDIVLQTISRRVKALIDDNAATLVRWGGDEFLLGILLNSTSEAEHFAQSLLSTIQHNIEIEHDIEVNVGASIGIIVAESGLEMAVDSLVKQADDLMYQIKHSRKNSFEIEKAR